MSNEQVAETPKPKRERKPKEAIIVAPEPEVRLGSLAINNPEELVKRASDLATVLADIIKKRNLYSNIQGKQFVKCEGWTTMGAMLGVIPVEDYCRMLANGNGFEAKINLLRAKDGQIVGSASAECTKDERNWKSRDSYSLRSMALTRATGKAFRLSYSWIMQLAGFQPTPAEEMMGEEDASVERKAVEDEVERQKAGKAPQNGSKAPTTLFYVLPEEHHGNFAEFINAKEYGSALDQVAQEGLRKVFTKYAAKVTETGTVLVSTHEEKLGALLQKLVGDCGIQVKLLGGAKWKPYSM